MKDKEMKHLLFKLINFFKYKPTPADRHNYTMLSRLQRDCEYFLGNGFGNEKNLYYLNVEEHESYNDMLHALNAVK